MQLPCAGALVDFLGAALALPPLLSLGPLSCIWHLQALTLGRWLLLLPALLISLPALLLPILPVLLFPTRRLLLLLLLLMLTASSCRPLPSCTPAISCH